MINKNIKIYIAGHNGMVGSACWKLFKESGYSNLIGINSNKLDLRNQALVQEYFKFEKPEMVIDAAAIVGGIWSNSQYPYKFLMENMMIQNNLIAAAYENDIKKFIFLGSSCIYPKLSPQPIKEEFLLTDSLENSNQWYAIAKISGVKLCESIFKKYKKQFISLMPTNLYGQKDNFDKMTSHVLPAMIRKFHEAKIKKNKNVDLWGDGSPFREFMHVDDLAKAVLFCCENIMTQHIYNVGSSDEISIKNLSDLVKEVVGFKGDVFWNSSMPNGSPKKLLDSEKLNEMGWNSEIGLKDGIKKTYEWYLKFIDK